ncbi:MAG: hypothetical protein M0R80_26180 [Proteobacteria bacterium]|jgi:hypothetical protein|nr:hypothetical protein [Pseudomonadota bacterium]
MSVNQEKTTKQRIEESMLERIISRCELFSLTTLNCAQGEKFLVEGVTISGREFQESGRTLLQTLVLADEATK